jgi:hypothetical protein
MATQLATREQIKAEIQRRIAASIELDGDCRECEAPGIYVVREPEKNGGCNWSPSAYRGPPECANVIEAIVAEVQATFNVRE